MKTGKRKDGLAQDQGGGTAPGQTVLRGLKGGSTGGTKATRGMIKKVV